MEKEDKEKTGIRKLFHKKAGKEKKQEKTHKKETTVILRRNTFLKISRIALWGMLIFFFVKGIFYTFRPDTVTEAENLIQNFNADLEYKKKMNNEVSAFAQNFSREYLTYTAGEEDEYKTRLQQYMAGAGKLDSMEIYRGSSQAIYVQAYRMEQFADHQWDVFVLAEVEYQIFSGQEMQTERKQTCMKVPVLAQENGMIVEALPMFIHDDVLLKDYKASEYSGTALDDKTVSEIKTAVTNFLKAYYEQDETVINYYLSQDADRSQFLGLDGRYLFYRMNGLRCYQEQGQSDIVCIADFKITDTVNEARLQQKLRVNVVRGIDGKYYVKTIAPRV